MERVYELLQAFGYPAQGIDWLRQRRALVIIVLASASWLLVGGLVWLAYRWLVA